MGRKHDEEPDLWDRVTEDVTPLKGRRKPPALKKPATDAPAAKTRIAAPARTAPQPAPGPASCPKPGPKSREVDLRTRQRLERGQMDIEAVLDLHGHGQAEARETLISFLHRAYGQGVRCVLVITGKGKGGTGVLRGRLPEWVDEPPLNAIVLTCAPSRQAHGGSGAFYVLLRRDRGL